MASVIHRTTLQYLPSVNTPDYPTDTWIVNPDLSQVAGVPQIYWKISGDLVLAMTTQERATKDAAISAAVKSDGIADAKNQVTMPMMKALVTLLLSQLNVLRAKAGLADLTQQQVVTALNNALDAQ